MSSSSLRPDLSTLVRLFYEAPQSLGTFTEVAADALPDRFRALLAHQGHMTEAVESFYHTPVDVLVLEKNAHGSTYSRKILLTRRDDGRVVQFGIVRLDFRFVSPEVRRDIESELIPLGRVLIEHNVLRDIQCVTLWKVIPGPDLQTYFKCSPGVTTFGRTALISCNGRPAVELLEIVTPDDAAPIDR